MINYIWAFMIIAGVIIGGFGGNEVINLVATGTLDSAKEAVELCIVMLGVVGMWNGVMNIAREAGLIDKWTKCMEPVISFLFPRIPPGDEVRGYIAANMIANILGLGWAATPAGLKAMEGLARLEKKRTLSNSVSCASDEMCTLIVINISSLQLIPMNIIAYRSQYGSLCPAAIIGPGLLATFATTLVAIVFCKLATKVF